MTEGRTHYEVLEVAPSALVPEIRAAYHERARALHPDVTPDPGPDRDDEMRRVNESWRVLSDPQSRADYDRELADRMARRSSVPVTIEEQDVSEPVPVMTTDSALVAAFLKGWPLLVLGLVVAIFVFSAYATGDDGETRPDRSTGRFGWDTGDCLVRLPVPTPAPCGQEHDAIVVAITDDGAPCPGSAFVADVPGLDQLCIEYHR